MRTDDDAVPLRALKTFHACVIDACTDISGQKEKQKDKEETYDYMHARYRKLRPHTYTQTHVFSVNPGELSPPSCAHNLQPPCILPSRPRRLFLRAARSVTLRHLLFPGFLSTADVTTALFRPRESALSGKRRSRSFPHEQLLARTASLRLSGAHETRGEFTRLYATHIAYGPSEWVSRARELKRRRALKRASSVLRLRL